MHVSHLLGAAALFAGIGLLFTTDDSGPPADAIASAGTVTPPPASGHFVLVVEGDRDRLTVTHASHKADPWAGTPKGLTSKWTLSIRDAAGTELTSLPLDMSQFDLTPARKGQGQQVQGCVVRDARVAMLVNVPCLQKAASYVMQREGIVVGSVDAATVNQLAGGGR